MAERLRPPDDITPREFFTRWVPQAVEADEQRRSQFADTRATLVFELTGEGGGVYTLYIADGSVRGVEGAADEPDLRVCVDRETWGMLNRGEMGAPEALVRRRVKLQGDLLLAIKLHFILG